MSPRTGRPKIANPKNIELKLRLDQDMNDKLQAYCKKHGIVRTDAIRQGIRLILEADK